jgi:hypothetical protein
MLELYIHSLYIFMARILIMEALDKCTFLCFTLPVDQRNNIY